MKKYLLLLVICFSLIDVNAQSLMTVGEIYDYNIGDIFILKGGNWGPPRYLKTIITDKYFSSLHDTVYYTYDTYSYTAPACSACVGLYDTAYGNQMAYSNLNDTVGAGLGTSPHYWTPDSDCIDTAGYTGYWVDTIYYDACNILSTKIDILNNGPILTDSCYWYFEAHWGYDEFGKGVGLKNHYYNTCSEGPWSCEVGFWMIYYQKGNDSCGNKPLIPLPTSIDELKFVNSFNILPNPASTSFEIKNISLNKNVLVQIINPFGEIVYTEKLSSKNGCLINANLTKGIYLVRVSDGEINVVKKLVVE